MKMLLFVCLFQSNKTKAKDVSKLNDVESKLNDESWAVIKVKRFLSYVRYFNYLRIKYNSQDGNRFEK